MIELWALLVFIDPSILIRKITPHMLTLDLDWTSHLTMTPWQLWQLSAVKTAWKLYQMWDVRIFRAVAGALNSLFSFWECIHFFRKYIHLRAASENWVMTVEMTGMIIGGYLSSSVYHPLIDLTLFVMGNFWDHLLFLNVHWTIIFPSLIPLRLSPVSAYDINYVIPSGYHLSLPSNWGYANTSYHHHLN